MCIFSETPIVLYLYLFIFFIFSWLIIHLQKSLLVTSEAVVADQFCLTSVFFFFLILSSQFLLSGLSLLSERCCYAHKLFLDLQTEL